MFGDWGAVILQFVVTAVVVLGLVAVVLWLVRRYSAGGLGRIGRGRVPRLAIIDAMSVDGRRRLVLVRRDNVEHLILIGGPSDLVVEQAIVRPRRPKQAAAEPEAAPEPTVLPAASSQPIAFAQARAHLSTAQNGGQSADRPFSFRRPAAADAAQPVTTALTVARQQPVQDLPVPLSPARFVDLQRPTRIEPASSTAQFGETPETKPPFPELPSAELPPPEGPRDAADAKENGADTGGQSRLDFDDSGSRGGAPSPFARPAASRGEDTSATVNDLEEEMARLLGEITKRPP
jgi:hypothetical protein